MENEPQQAEMENIVKSFSADDKEPNFSHYVKKDASKPGDISLILDQSDDSLENENSYMDDSFDREEENEPHISPRDVNLKASVIQKAKSDFMNSVEKVEKTIKNNQNIQNFLESSLDINISNPKNLEEEKKDSTFSKAPTTESDISLLESENSQSFKFYQSSQDNGKFLNKIYFTLETSTNQGSNKDKHDSEAKIEEIKKKNDSGSEGSLERAQTEEIKMEKAKPKAQKSKSYTPIKQGKFIRKKELEGTVGRGDTLGGLAIAKIEILKFLGSGGEGKVFLGRIVELDQLVAFKQFEIVQNEEQEK